MSSDDEKTSDLMASQEPQNAPSSGHSQGANIDASPLGAERLWLDLAKIEQEVAELVQAVATRQHEAQRMWERSGEFESLEWARQAAITAWRLEREVLQLAEIALRRAKGELRADRPIIDC